MTSIAYTVRATLPDLETREAYVAWLTTGGHVKDVIYGGAERGDVVVIDRADDGPIVVEVRYTFPSREAFTEYEQDHAPSLREEGIAKFGDRGIVFERSVGEVTPG